MQATEKNICLSHDGHRIIYKVLRQLSQRCLQAFFKRIFVVLAVDMVQNASCRALGGSGHGLGHVHSFFQFVSLLGICLCTRQAAGAIAPRPGPVTSCRWVRQQNDGLGGNVYGQTCRQAAGVGAIVHELRAVLMPSMMNDVVLQQHVFARMLARAVDFMLDSASNAGSVAACLSYPTLIEPLLNIEPATDRVVGGIRGI